jgi:transcriptional regulator with XRE-family HTH domain
MRRAAAGRRDLGLARAVRFIRAIRDWSQHDLARASGIGQDQISRYESGKAVPSRASLKRMAAGARVPFALVELVLPYLREIDTAEPGAPPHEVEEAGDEEESPARAIAEAMRGVVEAEAAAVLREFAAPADSPPPPLPADRAAAERLWADFAGLSEDLQEVVARHSRVHRTWAFVERLSHESERAAGDDPRQATHLANLAVLASAGVTGGRAWRARVAGYARGAFANARRVANDHGGAEHALGRARQLWRSSEGSDPDGLLDPARLPDLAASLRRDQRRFDEALKLHDEALALAPTDSAAYVLLNKSATLEQAGSYEPALAVLAEAEPHVDAERRPRQLFALLFNRASVLWRLRRHEEAAALLPEIRRIAERLAMDLDLLRLRWLEARVAAGLGRREEAVVTLEEVQAAFADRKLPYDMALASLDLAGLYLEEGRTAEVKTLAARMVEIFVAQRVAREALMALQTFERAARAERATAQLAGRVAHYLERARHDPRLRFAA